MSPAPDLARLQRFVQAVVVQPGCVHDALASPDAEREGTAEEHVRPSRTLTARERLGIYHGMYLARMAEALEADYPAVRSLLGADRFADLVRDYVQAHPSRSYTLNRLGDALPEFVATWAGSGRPADAGYLHDLARVERAIGESFDAERSPVLRPEDVQAVDPADWPAARLVPTAALRVLAFRHPVSDAIDARVAGVPVVGARRRASWLALYRPQWTVMRVPLTRAEHDLLEALASGTPLGRALADATGRLKASERESTVFGWFRSWIARGMFSRVEV